MTPNVRLKNRGGPVNRDRLIGTMRFESERDVDCKKNVAMFFR